MRMSSRRLTLDSTQLVDAREFYKEYHGHKVTHLEKLLPALRSTSDAIIWLAGDSSLDNKYWFTSRRPAVGAYAEILRPPVSKCDVNYWLNYLATERLQGQISRRGKLAAINTAVEATTLNRRVFSLTEQDRFIRDSIGRDDILIVSIGGNDIALLPAPCTVASIAGLLCLPSQCIEAGSTVCSVPVDDCCCGCGASSLSCAGGCPPCLGYFRHMFGTRIEQYIKKLTNKTKPRLVLVCMIYYPDEAHVPSWSGPALGALGYNANPEKLQLVIRKVFQEAISRIKVPGSTVVPVPLFHILDGKTTDDYVQRVEPSPLGGKKMAEFFLDIIDNPEKYRAGALAPSSMNMARS